MRALAVLSLLLLALALPGSALARPSIDRIDLNDPALDAEESAFASELCGFPVIANYAGHILVKTLDRAGPGTVALTVYGMRIDYRNPANGAVYKARDIGPDRVYVKDGVLFVAVTGRSEGGTGVVGVVKINLETGEVVHQSGNEIGFLYDHLCDDLS